MMLIKSRRTGDTADKSRRTGDTADKSRRTGDTADKRASRAKKIELSVSLSFGASDRANGIRQGVPSKQSLQQFAQAAFDSAQSSSSALANATGHFAKQLGLSMRFVDQSEAHELNQRYRGKGYATNVLSFAMEAMSGVQQSWLGDLVVCVPVIEREAVQFNKNLRDHYAHMCVHGVLHLLGFDHIKKRDAAVMEGFGMADPYIFLP
jgi:probable rRNA maturation factor